MGVSLAKKISLSMLAKRVLVVAILLPVGLLVVFEGGLLFVVFVALALGTAAWEFVQLFRAGGLRPAGFLVVSGVVGLTFVRTLENQEIVFPLVSLIVLLSMTVHLIEYERGVDHSATDFGVTLAGVLYFGWIGAYLISLRFLPHGEWWLLLVLPAVWLADTAAYTFGRRFGRHKLSKRLSPNKSWEGYLAGILAAGAGTPLLAWGWSLLDPGLPVTPLGGALLGLVLAAVTPLGDLGESMVKRQVGVKDSGNLLPGHGGVFDRIDSWLWAGVIGYYLVMWLYY